MTIPFLDLARLNATIKTELVAAFTDAVRTSMLVGDSCCEQFERIFADAHQRAGAIGCGSGTDAVILALRALRVQPGDHVVIPAMTFMATAEAVVRSGATPVIADVDPNTLLLTAKAVAAVRTPRTRVVIPVHLYGHVVPFDTLSDWKQSGLEVIEDAAQAHLAVWQGQSVGTVGTAACFSFYPGKNLGALGDGGAVVSDNLEILERVRRLRNHGSSVTYIHDEIGYCSRLDGVQANVLTAKLRHLRSWSERRAALARRYRARLADLPPDVGSLVPWEEGAVHHLLVYRIRGGRREAVRAELEERGIGTGIHYPRALSRQPALARWARPCPIAERAASEVLSLPMDPLMTDAEVDTVCHVLRQVLLLSPVR